MVQTLSKPHYYPLKSIWKRWMPSVFLFPRRVSISFLETVFIFEAPFENIFPLSDRREASLASSGNSSSAFAKEIKPTQCNNTSTAMADL